jgi:hypothetical protein
LSDSAKAGGNPDPLSDATRWLYYNLYAMHYNAVKGTHAALINAVGGASNYSGHFIQEAI